MVGAFLCRVVEVKLPLRSPITERSPIGLTRSGRKTGRVQGWGTCEFAAGVEPPHLHGLVARVAEGTRQVAVSISNNSTYTPLILFKKLSPVPVQFLSSMHASSEVQLNALCDYFVKDEVKGCTTGQALI